MIQVGSLHVNPKVPLWLYIALLFKESLQDMIFHNRFIVFRGTLVFSANEVM